MPTTAPASTSSAAEGPGQATVTFRLFGAARADARAGEVVEVAPGPVADVLAALVADLPPRFAEVLAISSLMAEGVRLDHGSSAPISGGTVVDVLPPFAGG